MTSKKETVYQSLVVRRLENEYPGCFIIINDPRRIQGIPDILILFENKWAMLEVKLDEFSPMQPNQDHYVEMFDLMSFCSFIYPENEDEVFYELQHTLGHRR